jgi:hypothetical protein
MPRLRFYHGCNDLFITNFVKKIFPHLKVFELSGIYNSGGRLTRFIKNHATTLEKVVLGSSTLTDGSWRWTFQGLLKCAKLRDLRLHPRLCQKASVTFLDKLRPVYVRLGYDHYGTRNSIDIIGAHKVHSTLKSLVQHYHTSLHVDGRRILPKYFEVCLFHPKTSNERRRPADDAMDRYVAAFR